MSRVTPPPPSTPSGAGSPNDPKRPAGAGAAGMPAQRPNVTTPKAPEIGASAPPTAVLFLPRRVELAPRYFLAFMAAIRARFAATWACRSASLCC